MPVRCLALLFVASASATRSACPLVVDHALALESPDDTSVSLLQAGASFAQHSVVTAEVDADAEVHEGGPLDEVVDHALALETPDDTSMSLLQAGASFAQHIVVTAEVDADAEVTEGGPLDEDLYPSAGTEEVSLLSVAPLAVDVLATGSAPGAPMPKTPTAAALALARMVKEDRDAEANVRTSRVPRRSRAESAEETVWRYQPYNKLMADIRAVPSVSGQRTDFEIHPGAIFRVQEEVAGDDGITYLKLADGRGWLFDRLPNGGVMSTREETPRDIGTTLLETVSKFRSGFQATGASGAAAKARRNVPHGHRGNRLSNLLIPLALILCTIIFFLIISRFARPTPVESHVRPYMRHRGIVQDTYKPAEVLARPRSPLPQRRQSFNLVTGMYEVSAPIAGRELPPVQAQVIQQPQPQPLSAVPGQPPLSATRGRSPPRIRQAVTLEAGVDLHSNRLFVQRPSTRQSSAPPVADRASVKAEVCYADQWSPAPTQPFRSVQTQFRSVPMVPAVPASVPAMGSAQATLLQPSGR